MPHHINRDQHWIRQGPDNIKNTSILGSSLHNQCNIAFEYDDFDNNSHVINMVQLYKSTMFESMKYLTLVRSKR